MAHEYYEKTEKFRGKAGGESYTIIFSEQNVNDIVGEKKAERASKKPMRGVQS